MKQRALSLLLALILTMALAPAAGAAESFSDVPSTHWAYSDIMTCEKLRIVTGFDDGSFKPGDEVTGVQFIVMMTRTFQAGRLDSVVTPADQPWYYANIKVAGDVGLSDGLTIDENPMSRYDMALALYNELCFIDSHKIALGKQSIFDNADILTAKTALKDWDNLSEKQKTSVGYCYALGILSGMSDGTFSGESNMTRAQACAVIIRMMNLINGSTPTAPAQPTTPTQLTQPQQPEPPAETSTGKLANGQPATVENVQAILEEIKKEYPSGTPWGPRDTPNNNYYRNAQIHAVMPDRDVVVLNNNFVSNNDGRSRIDLVYGCGGWACMVSERIFGKTGAPCREVTDVSEIRPGDIVYFLNPKDQATHIGIVYGVDVQSNGIIQLRTCDGNSNAKVDWDDPTGAEYATPPSLGKENASPWTGYYIRIFTRYPD